MIFWYRKIALAGALFLFAWRRTMDKLSVFWANALKFGLPPFNLASKTHSVIFKSNSISITTNKERLTWLSI